MPKKFTHRSPGLRSLSLAGKMLKQFFLIGFALIFFLQQFHPNFFSNNAARFQKTSSRQLLTTKPAEGFDASPLISQEAIHSATEMEADEEDDRQNNEPELYCTSGQKYPADQLGYNYLLKTRYLQLASSVQQQPLIPFFILHHSWKNHIA